MIRATMKPMAVARSREMKMKYCPVVKSPSHEVRRDGDEDEHPVRDRIDQRAGDAPLIGDPRHEPVEEIGERRNRHENDPRSRVAHHHENDCERGA